MNQPHRYIPFARKLRARVRELGGLDISLDHAMKIYFADVNTSTLWNWLNGNRVPVRENRIAVAVFLGLAQDENDNLGLARAEEYFRAEALSTPQDVAEWTLTREMKKGKSKRRKYQRRKNTKLKAELRKLKEELARRKE